MSAQEYDELQKLKLEQLRAEIQKGLDDVAAGRVTDSKTAFQEIWGQFK